MFTYPTSTTLVQTTTSRGCKYATQHMPRRTTVSHPVCFRASAQPAHPPASSPRHLSKLHHTELIFPPTTHAACTPAHTVRDKSPESHSAAGVNTHRSLWASAAGEHGAGVGSDENPDIFALVLRFGKNSTENRTEDNQSTFRGRRAYFLYQGFF